MNDAAAEADVPDLYPLADLCLSTPLYKQIVAYKQRNALGWDLTNRQVQFDTYCIWCKQSATFRRTQTMHGGQNKFRPESQSHSWPINVTVICTRGQHSYQFMFGFYGGGIAKIGQSPSAADIGVGDLAELRGILDRPTFSELHKAEGLVSHGAAIGAFAYLRRVFENVIERHRTDFEAENGEIEGFNTMRMAEKIKALKSTLPRVLTANPASYSILSAGIHTLDEETCAAEYPVLRAALLMILRQDLRRKQELEDEKELGAALQASAGRVTAPAVKKPAASDKA